MSAEDNETIIDKLAKSVKWTASEVDQLQEEFVDMDISFMDDGECPGIGDS